MENKKGTIYSEAFKKEKVELIEKKQITVLELSRIYNVSTTAIYNWVKKYSTKYEKTERVVVEKESEGFKTIQLLNQVADLERSVGQKQLEIDFMKKLLEFGNETVGFDIKKKYLSKP